MDIKSNTIFLLVDKFAILFGSLVLSIFTFRVLGTEKVGILYSAQSFWALFGFLLSLGLESILVKYFIIYKRRKLELLFAAFFLKIIGSLLAIFISIISVFIYSDDSVFITIIFIICINGLFNPYSVIDTFLQSEHKAKIAVKRRLVAKGVSSVFNLILILVTTNIYYFATINIVYNLVLLVLYLKIINNEGVFFKDAFKFYNPKMMKLLLYRATPLILASISIPIFMQSDLVMVNYILGPGAAGIFSAAVKLTLPWTLIATAIVTAIFPYLVSIANNQYGLNKKTMEVSSFLFWGATILAIIVSLNSEFIIHLLYGDEFIESSVILSLQIWTCAIAFLGPVGSRWLIIKGLQKIELYKTLSAAIINVLLNVLMIPEYGLIGASVASLISYFIANILFFAIYPPTRQLFILQMKAINPFHMLGFIYLLKNSKAV